MSLWLLLSVGLRHTCALELPYVPPPKEVLERERVTPLPTAALNDGGRGNRGGQLPKTTDGGDQEVAPFLVAPPSTGGPLDPAGWTVAVDSFHAGEGGEKVLDGDPNTIWHTEWTPTNAPLPHRITIDMKRDYNVNGLTMLPRQDGNGNGRIGRHTISLSRDGVNFGPPVAFGTWLDDAALKVSPWETAVARYVRLDALSEAGGRGPWTSIATLTIYGVGSLPPPTSGKGKWGPTIDFPIVPVAAAVEHDSGNVVVWSAYSPDNFVNGPGGITAKAIYNPTDGTVTQRTVTNTNHDMFCPGISRDVNGRFVVTGGNNAQRTSIYDANTDAWIPGADMKIQRGYQSSTTCSDGRIFAIGGSWSGGEGGKNGEIYDPNTNTWTLLPNCPVAPMLTNDAQGVYRSDNHAWLFGWKNGFVFQAGPSKAMNWYGTGGTGARAGAGNRAADGDSMCGNAVMYDAVAGKILTINGSPNYQNSPASTEAHVITINNPNTNPTVTKIGNTAFNRIFHNSVVLPDGQVFIVGGQSVGAPFSDGGAHLTPEMFNPATNSFTQLVANTVPRTYHSVAVLMMDGTVLAGGGGLCGTCSTNHFDAQIYTPQYLLTSSGAPATRPVITQVWPASVRVGWRIDVDTNGPISSMSLVRFGSNTHSIDTDQRRIPLTIVPAGTNRYEAIVPNDSGIALPGYYMLFAMNSAGVPSVARTLQIRP